MTNPQMILLWVTSLYTLLFAAACPSLGQSAPRFEITEYINEDWLAEQVGFDVTLPDGLDPEQLVVHGDDGSVSAAQFVPNHANSRQGKVLFVADLPAKSKRKWTLASGKVDTDLFVTTEGKHIEFGTSKIAVRCPWNVAYADGGIDAGVGPAPVEAIRLVDGSWNCGSQLHSPFKVHGIKGEILVAGAVFVKIRLTYTFEAGKTHVVELQATAGQEVVMIWEKSELGDRTKYLKRVRPSGAPRGNFSLALYDESLKTGGSYWSISFQPGLQADRVTWQPFHQMWSVKPKPGTPAGSGVGNTVGGRADGDDPEPGEPRYTYAPPKRPCHLVTLNPTHGEWWLNTSKWLGVYSANNENVFLGLMAWQAGRWQNPHENVIVLKNDEEGIPRAILPMNSGARSWGLYSSRRDEAIDYPEDWPDMRSYAGKAPKGERYPQLEYARLPQLAWIKYGYLPLDMVKDWVLEFDDSPGIKYPRLFAEADKLPEIRARIATSPLLKDHVDRLKATWDAYRSTNDPNYPHYPKHFEAFSTYMKGLDNIYLATGDEVYAQALAELLIDRLHRYTHEVKSHHGLTPEIVGTYLIRQADIAHGAKSTTDAQKREIRALLLFSAYLFKSRDHAPEIGYNNHGNTDFIVQKNSDVGAIGCLLSGHPLAAEWAQGAIDAIEQVLSNKEYKPARTQDEWYGLLNLEIAGHAAVQLKRAGFRDFFQDPRMRDGLDFYGQLLTVPDPRHKHAGSVVPFGNGQGDRNRTSLWAVAASETAQTDPEFASRMMWYWQRAGKIGIMRVRGDRDDYGWSALGWIDPAILAVKPDLQSQYLDGFGALFRSGYGTDRETFMALQLGKTDGLDMDYNGEGAFHLYAKGKPLSLLFGIRTHDVGLHGNFPNVVRQRWMANRPSFDFRLERGGHVGTPEYIGTSRADLARGEWTFSHLIATSNPGPKSGPESLLLTKPRPEVPGLAYGQYVTKDVDPITWRRHVMFVKDPDPSGPNYFVIRDRADTNLTWDWNVWGLGEGLELEENTARFTGKFDIDMDVVPITHVEKEEIVTGSWGPFESFAGYWHQQVYQIPRSGSGEVAAVVYPRLRDEPVPEISPWANQSGAKVELPDQTHYVVLTDQPVNIHRDDMVVEGSAAVIRRGRNATTLALLSGKKIGADGLVVGVDSGTCIALQYNPQTGEIAGETHGPATTVTLARAKGHAWSSLQVDGRAAERQLSDDSLRVQFDLPQGDHTFRLK